MIFNFRKFKKIQYKKGMTYVELIVVLSIFSIMSAVTLADYGGFQAKVDIKNLANDIAMQIVGAQKNALAGKLLDSVDFVNKPAYGVYFKLTNNKEFISFADIDGSKSYSGISEKIDLIQITNGSRIASLDLVGCGNGLSDVSIVFTRPDSSAVISNSVVDCNPSEAIISISSKDDEATAEIHVYPSGRIEFK
jgi:prepilin-type N-terminal cleavage/methylation domain-containing protein